MSQSYSIRGSTELPLRSLSLLINSSARRKETYILGWFAVSVAGLSDELLLGVFYWPLRMINCMGLYSETAKVSQPNKQQPQSLEEKKKKIIDGWRGWLMDFVEFYRLYVVPQWVLWCSWGGTLGMFADFISISAGKVVIFMMNTSVISSTQRGQLKRCLGFPWERSHVVKVKDRAKNLISLSKDFFFFLFSFTGSFGQSHKVICSRWARKSKGNKVWIHFLIMPAYIQYIYLFICVANEMYSLIRVWIIFKWDTKGYW